MRYSIEVWEDENDETVGFFVINSEYHNALMDFLNDLANRSKA